MGTIDLLDILKDTAFITGLFGSVASREVLDRATLNRRLLLVLFALGTNMGIRQIRYRPHLINGCLAATGLTLETW